ncbi:SGNH/GDSL hydrolase family protein [Pradoshia sp.]
MTSITKRKTFLILTSLVSAIAILLLSLKPDTAIMDDQTLYEKLNNGNTIYYLVVGDSIGRGAGAESRRDSWYAQLERLIKKRYGADMQGQHISQSGATAFEGLYKLKNTELIYPADIIFLVFGENDRKYMEPEEFAKHYELLVREAKVRAPKAEIITFIESPLAVQEFANQIQAVSSHYGATAIDMRKAYRQSGAEVKSLNRDQVHPNGKGYELYAKTILQTLDEFPNRKAPSTKEALYVQEDAPLHVTTSIETQQGFLYKEPYWTTGKKGSSIRYKVQGNTIGAIIKRNPNGGMVDVFIDRRYYRTINTNWPLVKERYIIIAAGIESGSHQIEFITNDHGHRFNGLDEKPFQLAGVISATINSKGTAE